MAPRGSNASKAREGGGGRRLASVRTPPPNSPADPADLKPRDWRRRGGLEEKSPGLRIQSSELKSCIFNSDPHRVQGHQSWLSFSAPRARLPGRSAWVHFAFGSRAAYESSLAILLTTWPRSGARTGRGTTRSPRAGARFRRLVRPWARAPPSNSPAYPRPHSPPHASGFSGLT